MEQYIDKNRVEEILRNLWKKDDGYNAEHRICYNKALQEVQCELDTLEVKEVEEKFERPNIEAKDSVEVSSRMPHIDKSLLPIAEFIMEYCSWNLHKDEWNQPVLEVPLFRVLDALVQKGKPYCEG